MPAPGAHQAELSFAVGHADEPAHLAGVTHLAEHLLLRLAGLSAALTNGSTELRTVMFSVQGDVASCVSHLDRLAGAVRDVERLTDEDVRLELAILEREDPLRANDAVPSPATVRWGLTGPGTAGGSWPTVLALTRGDVVAWVRRWFTADRAVLVLLGDWAEGDMTARCDLPVGDGGDLPVPAPAGTVRTAPLAVPSAFGGVLLSVVVPADTVFALAQAVELDLFAEVRHRRGLAYEVAASALRLDEESALLELSVGAAPDVAPDAAIAVVAEARRRAEEGFSPTALERVRLAAHATLADPEALSRRRADLVVERALLGWSSHDAEEDLARIGDLDGEELRRAWSRALESLVLLLDEEADLGDGTELGAELGLAVDLWTPATSLTPDEYASAARGGRRWRDHVFPGLTVLSAALSGTQLLLRQGGEAWSIDLARVAFVLVRDGGVQVVAEDGRRVMLDATAVRRGASLVAGIVEVVTASAPERVRRVGSTAPGGA